MCAKTAWRPVEVDQGRRSSGGRVRWCVSFTAQMRSCVGYIDGAVFGRPQGKGHFALAVYAGVSTARAPARAAVQQQLARIERACAAADVMLLHTSAHVCVRRAAVDQDTGRPSSPVWFAACMHSSAKKASGAGLDLPPHGMQQIVVVCKAHRFAKYNAKMLQCQRRSGGSTSTGPARSAAIAVYTRLGSRRLDMRFLLYTHER